MPETDQETSVEPAQTPKDTRGSIQIGPLTISAKFSVVLIYLVVVGLNALLLIVVVIAALHRAGRL